jgi:hypothetical protein
MTAKIMSSGFSCRSISLNTEEKRPKPKMPSSAQFLNNLVAVTFTRSCDRTTTTEFIGSHRLSKWTGGLMSNGTGQQASTGCDHCSLLHPDGREFQRSQKPKYADGC